MLDQLKMILYMLIIVFSYNNCNSQNNEENKTQKIFENLQKFDDEAIYQIRVETLYCYEIRVNDIVILRKFNDYMNSNVANVNPAILKSGLQNVEFKIFPQFINKNEQAETLDSNRNFNLKIEKTQWYNGSLKEPELINSYNLEEQFMEDMNLNELNSYQSQITFEAKVPYRLINWEEGLKFEQKDSIQLIKEILPIYEKLKIFEENQKGQEFTSILKKGYFNLYQASYFINEEAQLHFNSKKEFISKKPRTLAPIENFYIEFSGNGRLVSLKRFDGFNKGEGVLRRYYKKNGQETVSVDDILLYKPTGSDYFEVIWYNGLIKPANL
jgi:hypothetical protein